LIGETAQEYARFVAVALKHGDRGKSVEDFQRALNLRAEPRFYSPLHSDGEFGPATGFAFEALGFALGLTVETIVQSSVSVGALRVIEEPTGRDAKQLARAQQRAPKLHDRTVAFDGTPTFWGLAKPLLRAREHGWRGTLQSSDRRKGVAERYGKRSQAVLFSCFDRFQKLGKRCPPDCMGQCNPANRPGESSHEIRSDGTAAFGNRRKGALLAWWELGLDVSESDALLQILPSLGYSVKRTYPNSIKEHHHINFTKSPGAVLPATGPHVRPAKPRGIPRPRATAARATAARVFTGVDVSNNQESVDFKKIKAAGHTFAIHKASDGLGTPDRPFQHRWKEMRAAGLVRGAYHFARPQKGRDPKAEVHEFLRLVDQAGGFKDGDLRPVLDIEAFGAAGRLTASQTVEWVHGFVEEMRHKIGRRPVIYTGVFWRETMRNPPDNFGCHLWLSAFVSNPKQFIPRAWTGEGMSMWQHTETGRVDGVRGPVDLNRILGGEETLRKRLRL
jgi:lysozyme